MLNRPIEVQELIQRLLELNQPHAHVEVRGEATCHAEHEGQGYADVPIRHYVVGVRSALNKVILEVEE